MEPTWDELCKAANETPDPIHPAVLEAEALKKVEPTIQSNTPINPAETTDVAKPESEPAEEHKEDEKQQDNPTAPVELDGWGQPVEKADSAQGDGAKNAEEENAEENEEEDEEEPENVLDPFAQTKAYDGAKEGINQENVHQASCYFAIDGKTFGIDENRQLVYLDNTRAPRWLLSAISTKRTSAAK